MVTNHISNFESARQKADLDCRERERKLFHLLKGTLSVTSFGRVQQLSMTKYEDAETNLDTKYLVEAIIISHSPSAMAGSSVISNQEVLMSRVDSYMACKQGTMSLEKYLQTMNDHVKAIKSMDANVNAQGEGGYLGPKADQVLRFLLGTGATKIVEVYKNGLLPKNKVPTTFEDVCQLLIHWTGTLVAEGTGTRATSIMTYQESIYGIGTAAVDPSLNSRFRRANKGNQVNKNRAERNNEIAASGYKGTTARPPNPLAPLTKLVRTIKSMVPGDDRPCDNCGVLE